MSTTVNVRVDKSRLTQQLKDNSAATQQQAAQTPLDEAIAEQVRANNESLRRRQQEANAKYRESRHDPIGRRDDDLITLPNQLVGDSLTGPVIIEDGAQIMLARVGVRRNPGGRKILIYPWGIEGALARRLSDNYNTAVQEASGVGVELELPYKFLSRNPPPPPQGSSPPLYRPFTGLHAKIYDMSPYLEVTSFIPIVYGKLDGKFTLEYNYGYIGFPLYDYEISSNPSGYIHYLGDVDPGSNTYTYYAYEDRFVSSRTEDVAWSDLTVTTEFILPAGGDRALYVLVFRNLASHYYTRFYYEAEFSEYIRSDGLFQRSTGVRIAGKHISQEAFFDDAASNEVFCVLVNGGAAIRVDPSPQLIAACDSLVPPIEEEEATGNNTISIIDTAKQDTNITYSEKTFKDVTTPAFELSNLPKQPYADKPPEQQVLDKQLGIGYLESADHSGKFFTPAIYEWLSGNAKLRTRYSEVAPTFYQPGDSNNPFVGVYLSVTPGSEEAIEMRATATQPTDITTAHTALDWVTLNTSSRYGDYIVWDWGNPEYCQQRLQALGMNV